MIRCKTHFIAACFSLLIPMMVWAEAPVVDESDNFAILDEQQSAVRPKYDEPQVESVQYDSTSNQDYSMAQDDGPALAHEDTSLQNSHSNNLVKDNASLIERVQTLQKEVQELRGQIEVQAHELQTLKEQQLTFYKDLDSRVSMSGSKTASLKTNTASINTPSASAASTKSSTPIIPVVSPASRVNPADEQISYLAAYELVKNKQYDNAINAMQRFVQKYPQGGYSANAYYWLGELYLVKKDYSKAAGYFETVLQQFPSSNKKAASLLKAGYAYAASGNNQLAKQRLQQVITAFPNTSTAQLASLKLETLNTM